MIGASRRNSWLTAIFDSRQTGTRRQRNARRTAAVLADSGRNPGTERHSQVLLSLPWTHQISTNISKWVMKMFDILWKNTAPNQNTTHSKCCTGTVFSTDFERLIRAGLKIVDDIVTLFLFSWSDYILLLPAILLSNWEEDDVKSNIGRYIPQNWGGRDVLQILHLGI